jgi:hypothetical protein
MKEVWVVSLGYGSKVAFDTLDQATDYVRMLGQGMIVDSTYLKEETYWREDHDKSISITKGNYLTAAEVQTMKD